MGAITDIPIAVGNSLGIADSSEALLVGGLILSSAVMVSLVMVMSYASRGRGSNMFGQIIVMFSAMGFLTAIAWLPVWVIVVGIIAVVALFAGTIMDKMGK